MRFAEYHAHVYFNSDQLAQADVLRSRLISILGDQARVYPLVNRPIGPHSLPMFEIDFSGSEYDFVVPTIDRERNDFNVLIHPLSGDALADHKDYAEWLGTEVLLDLSRV